MRVSSWNLACVLALNLGLLTTLIAQTGPDAYTLKVPVDEVAVTFHVADWHGAAMDDLTVSDVRLTDNGKPPGAIVSFEKAKDLPVRVGILVDTSRSVLDDIRRNQWVASQYLRHLFSASGDRGFVLRFDSQDKVVQDWTADGAALEKAVHTVASDAKSRIGGTALFDAVYRSCRDQFGRTDKVEAGNFILLFSDGVDNASHALLEDDIRMCQSTNTAIYVFSGESGHFLSEGQKVLRDLAAQSGGQIFFEQQEADRWRDLQRVDANVRSQYRLVYRLKGLKRDGSFHRIKLTSPSRGGVITTRAGYYAGRQGAR
jgi:VWFA-related protein